MLLIIKKVSIIIDKRLKRTKDTLLNSQIHWISFRNARSPGHRKCMNMCARIYIIADQLWNRFNCDSRSYLVGPDFGCSAVTVRISPSFVGDFSFISYKLVLSAQFYFNPIQKRSEFVLTKRFINRNFIYPLHHSNWSKTIFTHLSQQYDYAYIFF